MADAETTARDALKLMDEGRFDEWEETMEPECEFAGPGSSFRGRKAIRAFVEAFHTAFPDVKHTFHNVYAIGDDTVVVEYTFAGTHNGPLRTPGGDLPPTGRRVSIRSAQVVEMRDGKAVALRTYFDRMELMAQLGLLPTPTA